MPRPFYPNRTRADLIHAVTHMVSSLSAVELDAAVSAVDCLRATLGDDVIWNAIECEHVGLSWLFVNRAPWTRLELIRIAQDLRAVQSGENLSSLLMKLGHPERWSEGASELEVAARFARNGFDVQFEPPTDNGRSRTKHPDFRAIHAGTGVAACVEVTVLRPSGLSQRIEESYGLMWPPPHTGSVIVFHTGRIHRILTPQRVAEFRPRIIAAAQEAAATGKLVEVSEPHLFEFAFEAEGHDDELVAWSAARGLSPGTVETPDDTAKLSHRIAGVIQREGRQLPANGPGVVVVWCATLSHHDDAGVEGLVYDLQEELCGHPRIAAVVVADSPLREYVLGQQNIGEHTLVRAERYRQRADLALVIRNLRAEHPAAGRTATEVLRAFGGTSSLAS
jgi:hypothetical protein